MFDIGILGKGYFGSKIFEVLTDKHNIKFYNRRVLGISFDLDWAIISSSTDSHFELCKLVIKKKVNEKD
jgi:hypothetical protein